MATESVIVAPECCHQTMIKGTRCIDCPLQQPGDVLVQRRGHRPATSREVAATVQAVLNGEHPGALRPAQPTHHLQTELDPRIPPPKIVAAPVFVSNQVDGPRLMAWMAHFLFNCATDVDFAERIRGNEAQILADFRACTAAPNSSEFVRAAWESASRIQEGQS